MKTTAKPAITLRNQSLLIHTAKWERIGSVARQFETIHEQESIPVGCVPLAFVVPEGKAVGYRGWVYPIPWIPPPPRRTWERDTIPSPERTWDQGQGGNLKSEIPYPLPWTDKHL